MVEHTNCLIIGSGPAGYTAAIYSARAGMKPLMITGLEQGGQLMQTTEVENFPGYPQGVLGPEMMEDFKKQAERVGAEIQYGYVTKVEFDKSGNTHKIWVDDTREIHANTVIIATGAKAKWLGLESEQRLNGYGVSACAVCDGFFYKNKEVAIVGAGDTACEEAMYLAKLCTKVHMFIRRSEMRASKIMTERVLKTTNIQVYWNTETVEILGKNGVEAVQIRNNKTQETTEIPIYGFFVAIGHSPSTELFKGQLDMDDDGFLITKPKSTYTNIPGVFACGDAQDKVYKQAVTAAGTGCMAALDAERWYAANKH
jgi:thioredoxin reductase (NADPH)